MKLLAFGIALALPCVGQLLPASNIERLSALADSFALGLCAQVQGYGTVGISIEPHPAQWLAEHAIALRCAGAGLTVLRADTLPHIRIALLDVGIHYEALSADRMRRVLRWSALATLHLPDRSVRALPLWQKVESDTVPVALRNQLEQSGYAFATAPLPQWRSLWQTVAEPAIALLSGAVIVLLLFTLRTH